MKSRSYLPLLALILSGCTPAAPPKSSSHANPPAVVSRASDELELGSVRLTPEAEKRLGIQVASVESKSVSNRRVYPGVVVVPPQNQVVLLSPVAGRAQYDGPQPLAVGTSVTQGDSLFSVAPLVVEDYALGPSQRESIRAARLALEQGAAAILTRLNNAQVELQAAQIEQRRSEQLFSEHVGSRKRVDDAKARVQLAQETVDSAKRELDTLQRFGRSTPVPTMSAIQQPSPLTGTISRVLVSSGQSVSAGQPLIELMRLHDVWIRVRVPQGEIGQVRASQSAQVLVGEKRLTAGPVKGAPTADPTNATFDLYYALENSGLSPDQRLEVSLTLKDSGLYRMVPSSSVLYDVQGGTWVYVRTQTGGKQAYRRERVLLESFDEKGQAVLSKGPKPGTPVVTAGAAELFGIEFGND